MALPRESTFLPTIKCSLCSGQVEISMMGEHICPGPSAELSPPPDLDEEFQDQYDSSKHRPTPPAVDTGAANRSYMHQGQITPVSNGSASPGGSPVSPTSRPGLDRPNNHFAPKSLNTQSSTPRTRRPGGYGGLGDQDGSDVEQADAPKSADKPAGGWGFLDRMNSIAPGPFDATRKPSGSRSRYPVRKDSLTKWDGPGSLEEPPSLADRPGTSHSNTSAGSSANAGGPKAPRKNGYGGFGAPSAATEETEPNSNPFSTMNRSETFPKPAPITAHPMRRPSAPGFRSERLISVSAGAEERRPSAGPDTSRPPPPRTSLIPQLKSGNNSGSVDLAAEFGISNPYHTPSGSGSSGYSNFTDPSQASSQTSPARSQTHHKGSGSSHVDRAMNSLQSSMENLRPKDLRIDPAIQEPLRTRSPMVESPYGISPSEDRHDPAIQSARPLEPPPRSADRPAPPGRFGSSPHREPGFGIRNDDPSPRRMGPSPGPRATPPPRQNSRDPTLPSRGDCKACGLPIKGKSVSSADGRLSGKYHKACFVCTTCSEPFACAEVYVLSNKPYCEQHYHKLNGSLCGSCGRGIEGQYLEDETRVKYHVGCFRCLDCGHSLSDGYFEVDGKSYCERDAWKRTQQSTGPTGMMGEPDPYQNAPPLRSGPGPRGPPNGRPRLGPRAGTGGPPRGGPRAPYGIPPGTRTSPRAILGVMPPRPQMNKRMTRLGMM